MSLTHTYLSIKVLLLPRILLIEAMNHIINKYIITRKKTTKNHKICFLFFSTCNIIIISIIKSN